ncbi:hypothetical protein Tco_1262210 [Tanacetum coccineum]
MPRVPLILGRPFLRTAHALIDVYEGEITLRNDDQSLTLNVVMHLPFLNINLESLTEKLISSMSTCGRVLQEVLGFLDSVAYNILLHTSTPIVLIHLKHLTPLMKWLSTI